jgi:hypothetical protein
MKKTRRKIDAGLGGEDRAGGAAGAVDSGGPVAALRDSPEPDLRLEKQLQEHAARPSMPGMGRDAEADREPEKLRAKIDLYVRDWLSRKVEVFLFGGGGYFRRSERRRFQLTTELSGPADGSTPVAIISSRALSQLFNTVSIE